MKYLEWVEPFDGETLTTLICRLSIDDVVTFMRNKVKNTDADHPNYEFIINMTDKELVDDFMVVHWAKEVED